MTEQDTTQQTPEHAQRPESKPATTATSSTQQPSEQISILKGALKHVANFPTEGIEFVDILPLFASHELHETLIRALELHVLSAFNGQKPDIIVGLDARGFLFGPSLALRLGVGFAPVRKPGKLPGELQTVSYGKEYGTDSFSIQKDAVKPGQKVLVVDDIIATGKRAYSASAR